jgi:hypothetical protein
MNFPSTGAGDVSASRFIGHYLNYHLSALLCMPSAFSRVLAAAVAPCPTPCQFELLLAGLKRSGSGDHRVRAICRSRGCDRFIEIKAAAISQTEGCTEDISIGLVVKRSLDRLNGSARGSAVAVSDGSAQLILGKSRLNGTDSASCNVSQIGTFAIRIPGVAVVAITGWTARRNPGIHGENSPVGIGEFQRFP